MLSTWAPRRIRCFILTCIIVSARWQALMGQAQGPPRAELERFAWMVGDWDTAATYWFAPEAPSLKAQSTEKVRWALNHQFLITEQEGLMPHGWHGKLIITGWDEKGHNYKMVDVDSSGVITELSMTMDHEVRTIVYYPMLNGRRIRTELRVSHVSDVEYTTRGECTDLDKSWICYDAVSKKKKSAGDDRGP